MASGAVEGREVAKPIFAAQASMQQHCFPYILA